MTSPRVALHIGAMKTGTTYVQRMLGINVEALAAQGITLPPALVRPSRGSS